MILSEDTPNFVANRIGIFSTVYAINAMDKYGLTIEEVDAASGRALARSVTATYGTSNLAGTDVLAYAVAGHYETAVDDEMREQWRLPQWILDMVAKGYLGEKTGGSFFREKRTLVIDPATLEYRPWQDPRQPSIAEANKISDPVARVKKFISLDDDAARFGWDLLAATLVYSANRVPEICADIAQIDRGMRWGYAWDLGPFELWDALGVKETVERMQAEGRAVPEWVVEAGRLRHALLLQEGHGRVSRPGDRGRTGTSGSPPARRIIVLSRSQGRRARPWTRTSTPASSTWATGWPASSSTPRPTPWVRASSSSSRRPSSRRATPTTRWSSATRASTSRPAPTSR